jgi:hypothetical protein
MSNLHFINFIIRNRLPDYLCIHSMALRESEVIDLIWEGFSFLVCAEASIIRLNSSALLLVFPAYTGDFIHLRR